MRLWPKSLAGRLAALLVLTLVLAQIVTFALFAGERVSAFRNAFREDLFVRFVSLARLLEETPASLRDRIVATASSSLLRISLDSAPRVEETGSAHAAALRDSLAAALDKPPEAVRVRLWEHRWRENRHESLRVHTWVSVSAEVGDGTWLNAAAERPPVPPLGKAFLASFLISAIAVAAVGAFGVRVAAKPLRQLAGAAVAVRREQVDDLVDLVCRHQRAARTAVARLAAGLPRTRLALALALPRAALPRPVARRRQMRIA